MTRKKKKKKESKLRSYTPKQQMREKKNGDITHLFQNYALFGMQNTIHLVM